MTCTRPGYLAGLLLLALATQGACAREVTAPAAAPVILDLLAERPLAEVPVEAGLRMPGQMRHRERRDAGFILRGADNGGSSGGSDEDGNSRGGGNGDGSGNGGSANPDGDEARFLGLGRGSRLQFEALITWPRTLSLQVRARGAYRRTGLAMQVVLNGEPLHRFSLLERTDLSVELPAAAQRLGANRLELLYSIGEGEPLPADEEGEPVVEYDVLQLAPIMGTGAPEVLSARVPRLRLPWLARIDYHLDLTVATSLRLARLAPWGAADTGARLLVHLTPARGKPLQFELQPDGNEQVVELPALGLARLSLVALPTEGAVVTAGGVDIVGSGLLTAAPPAEQPSSAPPRLPRAVAPVNVLIYLVDTLRADHLGLYGYDRPTSERIDAFARDAVVFDSAQAQSSWTKPSVASIFTGLLPAGHGVVDRTDRLPMDHDGLAVLLRRAGYETWAAVTNSTVADDFDFDTGFHTWLQLLEGPSDRGVHQDSNVVTDEFARWLRTRQSPRPFFAYLHTTDPHEPYVPRPEYRDRFVPDVLMPEVVKGASATRALAADSSLDPARLRADLLGLYDAEIAFNDEQFGAVLDELSRRDLLESTLIIFLSDHGEEFLDHGGWSHGHNLFQETLRVPLLIRFPDRWQAGARVGAVAQHVDLLPTILDYLGFPTSDGDGISLLGLIADPAAAPPSRIAISQLEVDQSVLQESVLHERLKFIRVAGREGGPRLSLYDLSTDPGEQNNLFHKRDIAALALQSILKRLSLRELRATVRERWLDSEITERLRAMGYIQ